MTLIVRESQTSSAVVRHATEEAVATGLLLDAVFGTSAGVAPRTFRTVVSGLTTVPLGQRQPMQEVAVAEEVRSLRDSIARRGINRQQLARLLGVDRRSLSGWASGDIRPTLERLSALRAVARAIAEMDAARPGRAPEVLLSRRGTTTLLDAVTSGRARLDSWRLWLARGSTEIDVACQPASGEPIWGAAARALREGRLNAPSRERTVRPESTYEMNPDVEAGAFAEAEYKAGRRGYR